MKYFLYCLTALNLIAGLILAEIPRSSLEVMPPMNEIYHPVSTTDPEAQKNFDKGLTYIFAYNHDLAFHFFQEAAKQDPELAMAYWGMALALGQNINEDVTFENEIRCYQYIQKAFQLSKNATPIEQDYIKALATRYTDNRKADLIPLRFSYRNAMKKLSQKYPEDLDAASIYAESILCLDPWKWWTPEGKPKDGTFEAIDALEFVLMRNPEHIGANHYYIHALEESPYPQRALMSAHRLTTLLPESGHLLHMPCHIFILVGDYETALKTNLKAIAQDKAYFEKFGLTLGHYPLHYMTHNLYILSRIYMLMEDEPNALKTAYEMSDFIEPHLSKMPSMAYRLIAPLEIYLYFGKWQEILQFQLKTTYPPAVAYWHYSRAMAYANEGDFASLQKEKDLMMQAKLKITSDDQIANNSTIKVIDFLEVLLDAFRKPSISIDDLKKAIALQDQFNYDEPPVYFMPARYLLGFIYLKQGDAINAELAFREMLQRLQRNPRALTGLTLSLSDQGRLFEAAAVKREAKAAFSATPSPSPYLLQSETCDKNDEKSDL